MMSQLALPYPGAATTPADELGRSAVPVLDPRLGEREAAFLASHASQGTRKTYGEDLVAFVDWCRTEDIDPVACRSEDLDRWRDWMLERGVDRRTAGSASPRVGLSPALVRKRLTVISAYFEFLRQQNVRGENVARQVERPRAQGPDTPPPRWLSAEETNAVLDAAERSGPVHHALACLLFCYGQHAVHIGDLHGRDIFEADETPQIRLIGRAGRRLTQPLVGRTHRAIATLGELDDQAPLIDLPGDPQPSALRRRVARSIAASGQAAGIDGVTLLVVRHTWQSNARLAGVPEEAIAHYSVLDWSGAERWRRLAGVNPAVAVDSYLTARA